MYVRILLLTISLSLTLELCVAMIAKRMPTALLFDACIHGCKCYASQTQRTDPHSMYNVQNKQNVVKFKPSNNQCIESTYAVLLNFQDE